MNEFDKEYILNQLNDGYIDLGIHDEKEIEYLKLVVSNYENLQSKIDKAIELIEKEDLITYFRETKDLELANEFEDLYKDLKEDK